MCEHVGERQRKEVVGARSQRPVCHQRALGGWLLQESRPGDQGRGLAVTCHVPLSSHHVFPCSFRNQLLTPPTYWMPHGHEVEET